MYPIERDDYVNAYISAMTEEMKESGFGQSTNPESTRSSDRFTKVVAEKLSSWRRGAARPARPQPTH
ncbi:MAG: hypothetical protein ABFR89_10800 [Actinomycetota bacterium]